MKKWILALLLFSLSSLSIAQTSEKLHYRLSYSGLITGYLWKKLADVTLSLKPERIQFRGAAACRLTAEIDTSGYLFAEMIHPVRYHWESTLSRDLQRTLITRSIDNGRSAIHEVSWYDWESETIGLFRKRREIDHNRKIDSRAKKSTSMAWEKDIYEPAPEFVDPQSPLKNGLGYLIQSHEFKEHLSDPAIDPLAMIQRVRHHSFEHNQELQMLIAADEDLHRYRARLLQHQPLKHDHRSQSTLKIEVSRTSKSGKKGVIYIWLSDDDSRLPLRIDIKAKLGMIHLELLKSEEGGQIELCAPQPQLSTHPE